MKQMKVELDWFKSRGWQRGLLLQTHFHVQSLKMALGPGSFSRTCSGKHWFKFIIQLDPMAYKRHPACIGESLLHQWHEARDPQTTMAYFLNIPAWLWAGQIHQQPLHQAPQEQCLRAMSPVCMTYNVIFTSFLGRYIPLTVPHPHSVMACEPKSEKRSKQFSINMHFPGGISTPYDVGLDTAQAPHVWSVTGTKINNSKQGAESWSSWVKSLLQKTQGQEAGPSSSA